MQKFQIGDMVTVRPFDEIDTDDIGTLRRDSNECYAIESRYINAMSADGPFVIKSVHEDWGTFIYKLSDPSSGKEKKYFWAQGMLQFAEGYEGNDPIDPGSPEDLFDFLSA